MKIIIFLKDLFVYFDFNQNFIETFKFELNTTNF